MEQSQDDWPAAAANRSDSNTHSGSDALAAGLGNLVMSDCAVASTNLYAPWSTRVEAGWSVIYVVRCGECHLSGEGLNGPLQLQAGDTVLLPQGKQHWLSSSDTTALAAEGQNLWADSSLDCARNSAPQPSSTAQNRVLACRFRNHVGQISSLLTALPMSIHVPAAEGRSASAFEPTVNLIEEELAHQQPGSNHVVGHLVQVLLMQAIRHLLPGEQWNAAAPETAFRDPVIGASLGLINTRLGTAWTLASLAEAVGVSRSTFAARFVEKVGMTPLNFLWQRRMEHAVVMLCENDLGIKEIASRIGYKSESAFSTAFKRWCGRTPGVFRRERRI